MLIVYYTHLHVYFKWDKKLRKKKKLTYPHPYT